MKTPAVGEEISPAEAMKWALIVARRGAGFVAPNPMVGCVIVDSAHKFVADGWHARYSEAHAEVAALDRFVEAVGNRESLAGCHIYVSLEPCAHVGKTGSCAQLLAPLKPATLTYAIQDPNPLVAGQGAKILSDAGILTVCLADARAWPALPGRAIEAGVQFELVEEAEDLNEIFLWTMQNKGEGALPFVTVKVASTLDGRVAMHSGESKWITSEQAREKGHRLRLEHDAIIVGRRTVETDNPSLNVRLEDISDFMNSVVIVDPKAKLVENLLSYNVAKLRPPTRVFVCVQKGVANETAIAAGRELGFRIFEVEGSADGIVDLRQMLIKLREFGINSLYVEGGAGTVGPFLDNGLVHRLHVFMATSILGGKFATAWSEYCGVKQLDAAWKLRRQRVKLIGPDIHLTGRIDPLP